MKLFSMATVAATAVLVAGTLLAAPPKVSYLFPAGGQRGQTVPVEATGEFSNWPVQVWTDRPGISATCDKDKGKLQVAVAADVPAGVYWLRLFDGEGVAALRPFLVGTLPEVAETEPNDSPDKPQTVEPRVVINGKLGKAGDVDAYRLPLKAGQTLVAAVAANSVLGSPLDGVLQVCELVSRTSSSGSPAQVEAFVAQQNHDAVGLDPLIAFTAPRDGDYLVRLFAIPAVPNSGINFAGGESFVYRLTLTTGGYLDHTLPLAAPREAAALTLVGWNIPADTATIQLPAVMESADPLAPPDELLTWVFHPDLAGALAVPRTERAIVVATESSSPATPQEISLPAVVSGLLESAGDEDAFVFNVTKQQRVRLKIESRSLGFATDLTLAAFDEANQLILEADDGGRDDRDPQLVVVSKTDSRVKVVVRDLSRRGGPRMVYRLTAEPVQPDFAITLAADSFVLTAGKPLEIPVTIDRRDGFAEKLEFTAFGLPAGITAEPVTSEPKGDTAKTVKLVLKAADDTALPFSGPIRIEGKSAGAAPLVRTARFALGSPLTRPHWAVWLTARK